MPSVVAEGRRVIANVERVANLFVTKTVYAMLLAVAIGDRALAVPVPAPPSHDRQQPDDRYPRVLPRARAEPAPLCAGVRPPRVARSRGPRARSPRPRRSRRTRSRATTKISASVADRGDDHVAHRRSVGVEPARRARSHRAVRAVRRDGRARSSLILGVPGLRDWFALEVPTGAALWGTIASAAAGVAALEIGWQVRQWRMPAPARTPRWAWHGEAQASEL